MIKVLFISPYPIEGPSFRYRVYQYFDFFKKNGINCFSRPFMSSQFYKIIYQRGHKLEKCIYFLKASFSRFIDFFRAFKYDIVFIHLEAYPIGPPLLELFWFFSGKTIIYDLDDALYLCNSNIKNPLVKLLKFNRKIGLIVKLSKEVIVCNDYLKNYALRFKQSDSVHVIPTSLDTAKFSPSEKKYDHTKPVIGWIGSHSTSVYLLRLIGVFERLSQKYSFVLKIVGSNIQFKINNIEVINKEWDLGTEIEDFQSLDIGVYPLPDDEWIKGKTGFKTIQYMAMGVPCVVSDVGRNKEIVIEGQNGFLAHTDQDWIHKLSRIIEDDQIRKRFSYAGRKLVEEKFSLQVNAFKILTIIRKAHEKVNKEKR